MRGIKTLFRTKATLAAGLLAFATLSALAPEAAAQISVGIGIQPVCTYGYYDYAPYACSPMGFYGPGYFYNGIFLGMGPWAGWGYGHGWGGHRFERDGGGRYHGGGGAAANRAFASHGNAGAGNMSRSESRNSSAVRSGQAAHPAGATNTGGARPNAGHLSSSHAAPHSTAHAASQPAAHGNGGQAHVGGGGGAHGGGHR